MTLNKAEIKEKQVYNLPMSANTYIPSNKSKKMDRYKIPLLENGFPVCRVKFYNPETLKEVECNALIDTGAEFTCVDSSIWDELELNEDHMEDSAISGFEGDMDTKDCEVLIRFPVEDSNLNSIRITKWVLDYRKEYRVLLGMNFLRKFKFIYNGILREAWVEN